MSESDKKALDQILSPPRIPHLSDFVEATTNFKLHSWQRKHLCPMLEKHVRGDGLRDLIHGPPRYGKSIIVSKRFPAWALGVSPLLRIVVAGYNVSHAEKFCQVIRDLMQSERYRALFPQPACRIPTSCAAGEFSTAARSNLGDGEHSVTAVGLLSGYTGKGADLLIIDDPYASPDDARSEAVNEHVWRWWTELASFRVGNEGSFGNVLVMFHRYHEDDLAGRLMASGDWRYTRFPAIADNEGNDPTGREEGELLSPMKTAVELGVIEDSDPMTWFGQFQGVPRNPTGTLIKREWLKVCPTDELPPLERWVRFWDLATKAEKAKSSRKGGPDFTVGALVGIGPDHTIYVRDIVRFRAEWPDACQIIAQTTQDDHRMFKETGARYEVGVEKVAWMRAMIQDLFTLPQFKAVPLTPVPANGDKKERASAWTVKARLDKFRLLPGAWNQEFISEALAFDGTGIVHDDQVDAVSGAHELLWMLRGGLLEDDEPPAAGSYNFYKKLAGWSD